MKEALAALGGGVVGKLGEALAWKAVDGTVLPWQVIIPASRAALVGAGLLLALNSSGLKRAAGVGMLASVGSSWISAEAFSKLFGWG